MINSLKNIILIWRDEFANMFKDVGIFIFAIILPLGYPVFYAFIYNNETVHDVPVAVVNASNSSLSRQFVRNIDATPEAKVAFKCTSMAEAYQHLERQEVYGIIQIPSSFDKDLANVRQTIVGLYCDMCVMLYYKNLALACSNVSIAMNKDIRIQNFLPAKTDREAEITKAPILYEHVPLYNPQGGFASFLIPPVFMLIIQEAMFLAIAMSMGRQRENNNGYVIPPLRYYKNAIEITIGKALVYIIVFLIMAIYMHTFVARMFHLPFMTHYDAFVAFIIPYLLSCAFMGLTLSFFIFRREDSMLIFVPISMPIFFISGITWPSSNIPEVIKLISYVLPSTFGLNAYARIANMGAELADVWPLIKSLWIQCAVYFVLAVAVYRKRLIRMLKREK